MQVMAPNGAQAKVIGKYKVTVSDKGNRSSTRGCTKKREFLLAMTRDVINRAVERIKANKSQSVGRKRPASASPRTPNEGAAKRPRGAPRKHRFVRHYKTDSNYCTVCYNTIQAQHRAAGRTKVTRAEIFKEAHGLRKPRFCMSGCPACSQRMCSDCWAVAECNPNSPNFAA
jgi:hypothetical protein